MRSGIDDFHKYYVGLPGVVILALAKGPLGIEFFDPSTLTSGFRLITTSLSVLLSGGVGAMIAGYGNIVIFECVIKKYWDITNCVDGLGADVEKHGIRPSKILKYLVTSSVIGGLVNLLAILGTR